MRKYLRQIVYFSTASVRQDSEAIAAILAISRDPRRFEEVSGLLVAGGNRYLQIIEGPAATVRALLQALRQDPGHLGLTVLVNRKIETRSFAGPVALFVAAELSNYATLAQLLDRLRERTVDRGLRDKIDCFASRFTTGALKPPATPWTKATSYAFGLTLDRSH